ncbi:hypothetical protein MUP51_09075 [Candidatus Bathyarchaeota archaeon]|nr:hypothetical protein [Candidatus Bathyarchaeota archaeon]
MGRHYNVTGGNLYIFTTERDRLLDLGVFPKELSLFEAESSWRISPWIAVVEDVLQKASEMAQIILQLNDYEKINLPLRALEHYFLDGDEYSLLETVREMGAEASPVINLPDDAP